MAIEILLLAGGLVLLILGAEALVRGASRLAAAVGISPLIIGLTVVAFGTSSPEFAVTINSSLANQANIALGNIIGSNIFNVLFILGLSALIVPLLVSQQLVRFDVPLMIAVTLVVAIMAADGRVSRLEGSILFAGLIGYLVFLLILGRKESQPVQDEYAHEFGGTARKTTLGMAANLLMAAAGLGMLVLGSRWLVSGAVTVAQQLGVSELIIGLTIIAVGTSLPEVVTSVVASLRGERDIAVGNVVGSNLFNLLGVLGLAGILTPAGIEVSPAAIRFDIPVMLAAAVACLPIFFTGRLIARWEGGLFLAYYIAYTLYLILGATQHDALPVYSLTMLRFVIPLTVLTLIIVSIRAARSKGMPGAASTAQDGK